MDVCPQHFLSRCYIAMEHTRVLNEIMQRMDQVFVEHIYEGIENMYNITRAKLDSATSLPRKNYLFNFQQYLACIKSVPDVTITENYQALLRRVKPLGYSTEKLKTLIGDAIFHYILAKVAEGEARPVIPRDSIRVPSPRFFMHSLYIEAARFFYNNPMLMSHVLSPADAIEAGLKAREGIRDRIRKTVSEFADPTYITGEIPTDSEYKAHTVLEKEIEKIPKPAKLIESIRSSRRESRHAVLASAPPPPAAHTPTSRLTKDKLAELDTKETIAGSGRTGISTISNHMVTPPAEGSKRLPPTARSHAPSAAAGGGGGGVSTTGRSGGGGARSGGGGGRDEPVDAAIEEYLRNLRK